MGKNYTFLAYFLWCLQKWGVSGAWEMRSSCGVVVLWESDQIEEELNDDLFVED